jgi:hypothetical protein
MEYLRARRNAAAGAAHHNDKMLGARVAFAVLASSVSLSAQAPDRLAPEQVHVGSSTIEVRFAPGRLDVSATQIRAWITNAADAVAAYFGRFPVARASILVRPVEGRGGIFHGTTWGDRRGSGPFTRISVGEHSSARQLERDWMMTHELTHMAFPDIAGDDREHHWIEEGMATYIEPIARVEIGQLAPDRVWRDMIRSMPQGLPQEGDQGLDHTHTWGRTYWGGALFWLLADVQIREQTGNQKGLRDAMRGILDAGGAIDQEWPIERVLATGDKAVGCPVLENLYDRMKDAPVQTDLAALWQRLGVRLSGDDVSYDDSAPLANVRRAMIRVESKPAASSAASAQAGRLGK